MKEIDTKNLVLEENGWEILVNEKEILKSEVGDLVKIKIATVSPLDFEKGKEIRSVSEIELWVEIEKIDSGEITGILKSKPGYETEIKDKTIFKIGDKIFFKQENVLAKR